MGMVSKEDLRRSWRKVGEVLTSTRGQSEGVLEATWESHTIRILFKDFEYQPVTIRYPGSSHCAAEMNPTRNHGVEGQILNPMSEARD